MSGAAASAPVMLKGRYLLTETVRKGAQASVTQAFDRQAGAMVAIKRVRFGPDDARGRAGFEREAESLQALTHPNIVRLIEIDRDDEGHWFLVLEWIERNLEDVILADGPMSWTQFWDTYGEPLLDAICFAQNRTEPIAHRDIKPRNILVADRGVAKLADYGIAKLLDDGGSWAPVSGHTFRFDRTPGYAPATPEEDHVLTRDSYAFAAVALSCVTGRAFMSDEDLAVGVQEAVLPEAVREVLLTCLEADPTRRPPLASLLKQRLEQAMLREQVSREPVLELFIQLNQRTRIALQRRFDTDDDALIERFVQDEFGEVCGIIRGTPGEAERDRLELIGPTWRLDAIVAGRNGELVHVTQASEIGAGLASDLREAALVRPIAIRFGRPSDAERAGQQLALALAEARTLAERVAEERAARASGRIFRVWRSYLRDRADLEARRSSAIQYIDRSFASDLIVFTTEIAQPDDVVGQERVVSYQGGRVTGRITAVSFNMLTMEVAFGDPGKLPRRGEISINTAAAQRALTNQTKALDAVVFDRAVGDRLKPIILEPSSATAPIPVEGVVPTDKHFDDEKTRILRKALGVQDILAIEGPPGTGKTKLIGEIIVQWLCRNPGHRILLSSQTHIALDNVIERIVELDGSVDIIRIGRTDDARVAESSRALLLELRVEEWIRQVRAAAEADMARWATEKGVDRATVAVGMKVERLLGMLGRRDAIESEIAELTEEKQEVEAELSERADGVDPDEVSEEATQLDTVIAELRRELKKLDSDMALLRTEMATMGEYAAGLATTKDPADLVEWAAHFLAGDELVQACRARLSLLEEWQLRIGRSPDFNAAMLSAAQVIAGTCVGVAGVRGMEDVEYDLCIVDEASKATATEMLIPMARSHRWIVVGDPRQLPPFFDDLGEDLLKAFDDREIRATLLDRLLDERDGLPRENRDRLAHQYRMIRPIGELVSRCFYNGLLASPVTDHGLDLDLALAAPVTWHSTHLLPNCEERREGDTFWNPAEVAAVRNLLLRLQFVVKAKKRGISVAVIAGYTAQVRALREMISQGVAEWADLDVECNSVDAFQGRQADVCIYSVVRSNPRAALGFLKERPRLNVALSRGKTALAIVGDQMFCRMARGANPFRPVIDFMDAHEDTCVTLEIAR